LKNAGNTIRKVQAEKEIINEEVLNIRSGNEKLNAEIEALLPKISQESFGGRQKERQELKEIEIETLKAENSKYQADIVEIKKVNGKEIESLKATVLQLKKLGREYRGRFDAAEKRGAELKAQVEECNAKNEHVNKEILKIQKLVDSKENENSNLQADKENLQKKNESLQDVIQVLQVTIKKQKQKLETETCDILAKNVRYHTVIQGIGKLITPMINFEMPMPKALPKEEYIELKDEVDEENESMDFKVKTEILDSKNQLNAEESLPTTFEHIEFESIDLNK